jgi:hypothetical protein
LLIEIMGALNMKLKKFFVADSSKGNAKQLIFFDVAHKNFGRQQSHFAPYAKSTINLTKSILYRFRFDQLDKMPVGVAHKGNAVAIRAEAVRFALQAAAVGQQVGNGSIEGGGKKLQVVGPVLGWGGCRNIGAFDQLQLAVGGRQRQNHAGEGFLRAHQALFQDTTEGQVKGQQRLKLIGAARKVGKSKHDGILPTHG